MTDNNAFHFSQLHKSYGNRVILNDIDINLEAGQCLQLLGKNGSGKSTLLRILAGLEKPDLCQVNLDNQLYRWQRARKKLHKNIMYLHQQPYMFDGSVLYNLGYPIQHLPANEKHYKIRQAIDWAELEHLVDAPAKNLSGGEKQRVALARAWLHQPRAMLLDEPTANLDNTSREKSLRLINTLKEQGMALAITGHDSYLFQQLFDNTYELVKGQLHYVSKGNTATYTSDNVTPIKKTTAC